LAVWVVGHIGKVLSIHAMSSLPVLTQILLLTFVADGLRYWIHRLQHRTAWLWRFHALHHIPVNLIAVSTSRTHSLLAYTGFNRKFYTEYRYAKHKKATGTCNQRPGSRARTDRGGTASASAAVEWYERSTTCTASCYEDGGTSTKTQNVCRGKKADFQTNA